MGTSSIPGTAQGALKRHSRRPVGKRRAWLIALAVVVGLLACALVAAPRLIKKRVETQLSKLEDGYWGSVDGVDVRLLDGEIALQGLQIAKPHVRVPFLRAREFVIAFVRTGGGLRNALRVEDARVNLVDGPTDASDQWGPHFDLEDLRKQLPFELTKLEVHNSDLHFRESQTKPTVNVYVARIDATWDDLDHCLPPGNMACRSQLRFDGRVLGRGKLTARGSFRRTPKSVFRVRAHVKDLRAVQLNPLLLRYAELDLQRGNIDLDLSYVREGEHYSAVLVPYLQDLEVLGGERNKTRAGRELGAALAAGWFERKRGTKAVRVYGASTVGNPSFEIIDTPPALAPREGEDTR